MQHSRATGECQEQISTSLCWKNPGSFQRHIVGNVTIETCFNAVSMFRHGSFRASAGYAEESMWSAALSVGWRTPRRRLVCRCKVDRGGPVWHRAYVRRRRPWRQLPLLRNWLACQNCHGGTTHPPDGSRARISSDNQNIRKPIEDI